MTYDEALADRVRKLLSARAELTERKMFGGIAFMVAVYVSPERTSDDAGLAEWVEAGADFAASLPPK